MRKILFLFALSLIFKNDKVIEQFRYYSGSPEGIGR